MSEQKIVKVDSQILDAFSTCEFKMHNGFIKNMRPIESSYSIQRGSLVHDIIEYYYKTLMVKRERLYAMTQALEYGRSRVSHYDAIDIPRGVGILDNMREYFTFYAGERWIPLATEKIHKKVIFEDDELKLLYVCKVDLEVMDHPIMRMAVDHKTYDRWFEPLVTENQFTGYCTVLGIDHLTVNKIGFQGSYTAEKKFRRIKLTYSEARKHEWIHNTARLVKDMIFCIETNTFPMRRTSCGMYGGCDYLPYCGLDPRARDIAIPKLYKIGEAWNPEDIKD